MGPLSPLETNIYKTTIIARYFNRAWVGLVINSFDELDTY